MRLRRNSGLLKDIFGGVASSKFVRVKGASMAPTLADGDWLFCDGLRYKFATARRWDIVLAEIAGMQRRVVKRVVGLPGEFVELKVGKLYCDGVARAEWGADLVLDGARAWRAGADEFVLLGDNLPISQDSRHFGKVRREKIKGKLLKIGLARHRDAKSRPNALKIISV